jgi:hypothetical protein
MYVQERRYVFGNISCTYLHHTGTFLSWFYPLKDKKRMFQVYPSDMPILKKKGKSNRHGLSQVWLNNIGQVSCWTGVLGGCNHYCKVHLEVNPSAKGLLFSLKKGFWSKVFLWRWAMKENC